MDVRKKLVEIVKNALRAYGNDLEKVVEPYEFIADFLIHSGVTVQEWIPVTERMPQNYISVLVYIPTAEPLPMVHEAYIGDDGEWHSSNFYEIENEDVTHWMPLPEPPKEGTP